MDNGPGKIMSCGGKCPSCGNTLTRSSSKMLWSCSDCEEVIEPDSIDKGDD